MIYSLRAARLTSEPKEISAISMSGHACTLSCLLRDILQLSVGEIQGDKPVLDMGRGANCDHLGTFFTHEVVLVPLRLHQACL